MPNIRWTIGAVAVLAAHLLCEGPAAAADSQEKIAFSWEFSRKIKPGDTGGHKSALFVMNPDGSDLRQVTATLGLDRLPLWSPDGSRLLFESDRGKRSLDGGYLGKSGRGAWFTLWVMNPDGSDLRPLLADPRDDCEDQYPCQAVWSPDGTQIAFSSRRDDQDAFRIHRVKSDGTGLTVLTKSQGKYLRGDREPAWSPDGKRIAYIRSDDIPRPQYFFIADADGANPRRLEPEVARTAQDLTWSPDARQLRFTTRDDKRREIDVGGGEEKPFAGPAWGPGWSPDHTRLAYVRGRAVVSSKADGTDEKKLTRPLVRYNGVTSFFHGLTQFADEMTYSQMHDYGDDDTPAAPAWALVRDAKWFARDPGRIAFTAPASAGPNIVDIYSMNSVGGNVTRLTDAKSVNGDPAWAPGRDRIAFVSSRDKNPEIYVMNADGSSPRRLTRSNAVDGEPTWSPDGKQIAFTSDREGKQRVFVMGADGTNVKRLTEGPGEDSQPAWSPDGSAIAFVSDREGKHQVFTVASDGSGARRLGDGKGDDRDPAWSQDSRRLAFSSERAGKRDIYTMRADGSHVERVTDDPADDRHPTWSPDGRELSFATARYDLAGKAYQIVVVKLEGGMPMRLTAGPFNDRPRWSPSR